MLILESEGGGGRLFERGACLTLGPGGGRLSWGESAY